MDTYLKHQCWEPQIISVSSHMESDSTGDLKILNKSEEILIGFFFPNAMSHGPRDRQSVSCPVISELLIPFCLHITQSSQSIKLEA